MMDRRTAGRAAAAVGVLVLLVGIAGTTGLTNGPGPSTAPSGKPSHGAQATSTTSSEPTAPLPTAEPWQDLLVPPFVKTAELIPSDVDRIGVATNATFQLRSLTSTPGVTLAGGLRIEPPIKLTVKAGSTPGEAIVQPASSLRAGTRYRFELTAPDGTVAGAWAFIARAPLHVVTTIPGDKAIRVPLNTGIEITFDQDGATGVEDHVAIKPAVSGRFEQHGRTFAFVPAQPLAAATIYTVTIRAGIGLTDSSETLEHDVAFQFETASGQPGSTRFDFARPVVEVRPDVAPVVLLRVEEEGEDEGLATSVPATIHKLPTFAAAIDATRKLTGAAGWAVASRDAVVSTTGLERVASVDAEVVPSETGRIMLVPARLPSGRYLLTVAQASGPAQLVLLVTNLATYVVVGTETTVVWVNDLAAGAAVEAVVAFADGTSLGRTDASGLLRVATPKRLKDSLIGGDEGPVSAADILTIRDDAGRSTLAPLGVPSWGYVDGDTWYDPSYVPSAWWLLFQSDRSLYRQTDTIHLWGFVRARSDRSVPSTVEVRLRPEGSDDAAPILRRTVTPSSRGTFIVDLAITDLPRASYSVDLVAGGSKIASVWIEVAEIRKPAYDIDVTSDHDVYVVGQPAVLTASTVFYDGTAVPGLELQFEAFGRVAVGITDASGVASVTLPAGWGDRPDHDTMSYSDIYVRPVRAEEGDIYGEHSVLVLPARLWLSASGSVTAGRVVVDGKLTAVDLNAYEAALANDEWPDVPPGPPISGQMVKATVTRLVVTRTQTGTTYDYITKTAVPTYEDKTTRQPVGTYELTSAADGGIHLSIAAPDPKASYEVVLRVSDPTKGSFSIERYVSPPDTGVDWWEQAYLAKSGAERSDRLYDVGETVSVTFHRADDKVASGGRFLFIVAREGRLDPVVQVGPTFERPFADADLPGFTIRAAWLTGGGFTIADTVARVDPDSKRLKVTLTADQARYAPGDTARIAIRTTSPSGEPVAADLIVQALDEKLFTMGLAWDDDPIPSLMQLGSPGLVQSYASHATPFGYGGGMGDEGGDRSHFEDTATFQHVQTDATGRGTASFVLPDDLTSWHVTATAWSAALDGGQASILLPTGLPFFVDAILAPEYLVGDAPVLRVRAYGDALVAGDTVRFSVTAPGLGVDATASAAAFTGAGVALPSLPEGTHRITISGSVTHGGTVLRDTLVRTIDVIPSRLEAHASRVDPLVAGFVPVGGEGLTTYVITDAGRGSLIALLQDLASSSGPRFDQSVAAEAARQVLIDEFGVDPTRLPPSEYDASRYERDGIALLPYAGGDPSLTAAAGLIVPTLVSRTTMFDAFNERLQAEEVTREQAIQALAGLAGLGENVLVELRSYDWQALTLREQLWLALGLAASGDEDGARTIERAVLEARGQRLGPWVRVDAGGSLETSRQATALLLVLAARIGDPLSADMARYLVDQPSKESLVSLELLAYAQSALERLARSTGSFAVTVDGKRTEVALKPGGSYTLVLTSEQRRTLALERLEGSLAVVTSWSATGATPPASPGLTVTRTVSPDGTKVGDGLVQVTLVVTFGPTMPAGCYELTDLAPSGLAPVISAGNWWENDSMRIGPHVVDGQRVSWCASPKDALHTYSYRARVVTGGTYRWEPAILQSAIAPSLGASTPASTYRIN